MAGRFKIRHSKYRHIYADEPKPEQTWTGMLLSTVTGEQQYIKASAKYFAIALRGGGGPIGIGRLDRPGRFEPGTSPVLQGHTGAVLDFDFNPFDDSMLATASEDTTLKVWNIPENWEPTDEKGNGKAGESISESLVDLQGHRKKVTLVRCHPTANNVLASAAADHSVRVWDIEKAEEISCFDDQPDLTQDVVWDMKGDAFATSCKDKVVRLHDGRTSDVTASIERAHEGVKSMKLAYLNDTGKILSTGSSKQSAREVKVWDLRNLTKALLTEKLDNSSGVLLPLFDSCSNILYLCGKGDGIIRPYEFEDRDPYLFRLNDGFRSNATAKGVCIIPRRGNNIMACETARLLKVTNNQGVHPLCFTVPRKSDAFQGDIFPDCPAPVPAHTAEEWIGGSSKHPVLMSLDPSKTKGVAVKKTTFKRRSVAEVSADLKNAHERIKYLEKLLSDNGIKFEKE